MARVSSDPDKIGDDLWARVVPGQHRYVVGARWALEVWTPFSYFQISLDQALALRRWMVGPDLPVPEAWALVPAEARSAEGAS